MVTATGQFGKSAAAMKALIAGSDTFAGEQANTLTNGTFAADANWTASEPSNFEITGGKGVITINTDALTAVYQTGITLAADTMYRFRGSADFSAADKFTLSAMLTDDLGIDYDPIIAVADAISDDADMDVVLTTQYTDSVLMFGVADYVVSFADAEGESVSLDDLTLVKIPVFIGECNPGDGTDLPDCFCVIETPAYTSRHGGTGWFNTGGTFDVIFDRLIPAAYRDAGREPDAIMEFHNYLDAVIGECQALSEQAGYLLTRSWDIAQGPQRIEKENRMFAVVKVSWGLSE